MKEIEIFSNFQRLRQLAEHVWIHFKQDRCFEEAASLSYASLLAIVPLFAVVFGVASAFPVFDVWTGQLQAFIFENFIPASGASIQAYFESFVASVGSLTLPGTIFLILTALLLMMRIEKALNRIWRVSVPRNLVNRVAMYWAVLTLGPIALGAATALRLQPLFEAIGGGADSGSLRSVGVLGLTWLAFTFTFLLVPNRRVKFLHAAIGALLSALLFTLAKIGFVAFVSKSNFNVIYGTLATIPIFLFWLYLVWSVVLLGASLAAALTTFNEQRTVWQWPWEWEFLLAYRLAGHLWKAQCAGRSLDQEQLSQAEAGVPDAMLNSMLERFLKVGLVAIDKHDNWLLARDLGDVSLMDLYRSGQYHLPVGLVPDIPTEGKWDRAFLDAIQTGKLDMDQSLKSLYASAELPGLSHG